MWQYHSDHRDSIVMNHWWFKLWDKSGWENHVIIVFRERKFAHWASTQAKLRKLVCQSGDPSWTMSPYILSAAEGSPWNVTKHFHPVPMKCHHALPPSAGLNEMSPCTSTQRRERVRRWRKFPSAVRCPRAIVPGSEFCRNSTSKETSFRDLELVPIVTEVGCDGSVREFGVFFIPSFFSFQLIFPIPLFSPCPRLCSKIFRRCTYVTI